MTYTLTQYNELKSAIAQGVTKVRHGEKEINYRSLDEMEKIKRRMESELGIKSVSSGLGRKLYVASSKGL